MLRQGRVALHGRTEEVRRGRISTVLSFAEPQTVAPVAGRSGARVPETVPNGETLRWVTGRLGVRAAGWVPA